MTFMRIAWRNLWKRKRLTLILLMGIATGVFTLLFHKAFVEGFFVLMVDSAVDMSIGHVQVHHRDYLLRKEPALVIPEGVALAERMRRIPDVRALSPRVVCQGLVSSADSSAFVTVWGVEPGAETSVTRVHEYLTDGSYLQAGDRDGAFIGKDLADKLKVRLGEKIVVMVRNAAGEMSGGAFRVRGLYHTASGQFDKMNIYITAGAARGLLDVREGAVHEIAMRLTGEKAIPGVLAAARSLAGRDTAVRPWQELAPVVSETIDLSRRYLYIEFLLVFTAVAFGIVNAFSAEIFERMREFGIMMALGTRPSRIFLTLLWEAFFLGLFGSVLGSSICIGFVTLVLRNRIDYGVFSKALQFMGLPSVQPLIIIAGDVLTCVVGGVITVVVATLAPAIRAARFKPVEAIHHV
jgi:ABC-type lipoprotein release transport system permease subunit